MTADATAKTGSPAGPLSIVVVIAQYPPHHKGGYELRCRDICRELVKRGHRVTVLTSRVGARGVEDDQGVRVVNAMKANVPMPKAKTMGTPASTAPPTISTKKTTSL